MAHARIDAQTETVVVVGTSRTIDRRRNPLVSLGLLRRYVETYLYVAIYLCVHVQVSSSRGSRVRGIRNLPFITANIRSTSLRIYLGSPSTLNSTHR